MAWTTPITFVANSVLTAAQLNTYLRDNMMETLPAKATTLGSHFVVAGRNRVIQRSVVSSTVTATEALADGTTDYSDLTDGPVVTLETDTKVLVMLSSQLKNSAGHAAWMSYEISGATTSDAQNNRAIMMQTTLGDVVAATINHNDLTPGINTFTAKYRVSTSGIGTFSLRQLAVFPF